MSRSNNVTLSNPCTRWFEWSGSEGKLRYYDKDTKQTVLVDLPFTFLVLDRLHTAGGYCDAEQSGFWANEVRDSVRDTLTVRTRNGVVATGVWKQLPAITGLKYAQSVYISFKDEQGQLRIGNLKASGAFVSAWIEFSKGRNLYEGAVTVTGAEEAKKGATRYYVPVFAGRSVSAETDTAAKELDVQLQEYLASYLQRQTQLLAGEAPLNRPAPPLTGGFHEPEFGSPVYDEEPEVDSDIPF